MPPNIESTDFFFVNVVLHRVPQIVIFGWLAAKVFLVHIGYCEPKKVENNDLNIRLNLFTTISFRIFDF